jgi:hypothetical protein
MGDDIVKYLPNTADACAIFFNREYILSFPSCANPERVFRFKATKNAWYVDDGPRAEMYFVHGGSLHLVSSGKIYECSRNHRTDNGTEIIFRASFAHERLSTGPAKIKKLFLYAQATSTLQHLVASVIADGVTMDSDEMTVTVSGGANFQIGLSGIGVGSIGRSSEIKMYERKTKLKGAFAQVEVTGTGTGENLGILGYSLEYVPKVKMKGVRLHG